MSLKQVQAVINATATVLGDDFVPNETNVSQVVSKAQKEEMRKLVFEGIISGEVAYSGNVSDEAQVKRYVNGMINNHLRKSPILNGGNAYKPSNSGNKRDAQLRELNKLLNTLTPGTENHSKVVQSINARAAQIKSQKTQKQTESICASVDTSLLPDNLVNLLNS